MFFRQIENLLPKKQVLRVALNTLALNISFLRLRGFKKRLKIFRLSRISKISLGVLLVLFLAGYQPVLTIPPVKKSQVLAEYSQQQNIDSVRLSQAFNLPHPGYLTTRFASWHPGIDLATGLGMPVRPIANGQVMEVNYGFWGYGHYVVIEHEQGFKSLYGHMGRIFVKKDEPVTQFSIIGEVGMTGNTSGPHTHLEVSRYGKYLDPQTLLPPISDWPAYAGQAPKGQGKNKVKTTPTPTPTPVKLPLLRLEEFNTAQTKTEDNPKLPRLLVSQLDRS